MAGINKKSMAYHNRIEAVRQFYKKNIRSKKEIASQLDLSIPTITNIFNDLEKREVLISTGKISGSRGKHQGFWMLNPDKDRFLCILISINEIQSVVVNSQVEAIAAIKKTKTSYKGYDELVSGVFSHIAYWKKMCPQLKKAAISCHGVIDYNSGDFLWVPLYEDKRPFPFKRILEEKTGLSIKIDNNCNVFALAEKWLGSASGIADFVWMNLDLGIGGGLVLEEEIHRGAGFTGGEIGHLSMLEDGQPCACGNKGCLTTIASSYATYMRYRQKNEHRSNISLEQFFTLINNKDPEALAELKYSAHYLARAILHLVSLISPQKIYLGGTLISAGEVLLEFLKEELSDFVLIKLQDPNLLEFSKLSKNSMLYGAAFLWIEEEISLLETKRDKAWGNGNI